MRQAFIVGDGPGLLAQAHPLMDLGWAVTATQWANAPELTPSHVLIACVSPGALPDMVAGTIRAWSASAAVIGVVDPRDPEAANDLYRCGAVAVVEASLGAAAIAQLADRLLPPAAKAQAPHADRAPSAKDLEGLPDAEALTMGENLLLQALLQGFGRIVPYERLFAALGYTRHDAMRNRRALAAQIVRLRKKLPAFDYRIRSRNNAGYVLMAIPAAASQASSAIPLSDARRRRESAAARQVVWRNVP